jgi:iron-sulfur cluster insertion protein
MQANFLISPTAQARLAYLLQDEPEGSHLRIAVQGGGCSGFQYLFDLEATTPASDDHLFEGKVVIDETSLEILNGSMLDYAEDLSGAAFEIKNPNAKGGCGCGNSFSLG